MLEYSTFVRKPFTVEAVEVTDENIEEIAQFCGTLREKENGQKFIQVDRRLVPNVFRIYPGFWMTKMDDNVRCYSRRIFTEQFARNNPEIENFVKFMNNDEREPETANA